MNEARPAPALWYPPIIWSASLLAVAPFMARIQGNLQVWLGGSFRWILVAALLLAGVGSLLWVASRIREHRWARWSALALVIALIGGQLLFFRRADAKTDLVEKIHLVEYGLLALLVYRVVRSHGDRRLLVWPLLWVAAVGTMDEWIQWLAPTRVGEWVDVLLNLFAGVCGVIFALAWNPPEHLGPMDGRELSRSGLAAAGAVLLFAAFFQQAHLGYRIEQPGDLDFVSWHSSERLAELSQMRAVRWANQAPGPLPLIGVEDTYRSEAAFHAESRNASLVRGDHLAAWKENRILEIYYAPFLTYRKGHRWPAAQRRNVERRLALPEPAYSSPVLVGRVFVRPSATVFWGLAILFALSLAGGARRVARRRAGNRI